MCPENNHTSSQDSCSSSTSFSCSLLTSSNTFSSCLLTDEVGSSFVTEEVGVGTGVAITADSWALSSDSGEVYSGVGAGVGIGVSPGEGVSEDCTSSNKDC